MIIERKGQLNNLSASVLAVVVPIIILVFGLVVINELRDTSTVQSENFDGNQSSLRLNSSNPSQVSNNPTNQNLFGGFSIVRVINTTDGVVLGTGNYTTNATGYIFNGTSVVFTNVIVTYTYAASGQVWKTANDSLTGVGSFADFVAIIVLAIVASLVIGLILAGFAFRRNR